MLVCEYINHMLSTAPNKNVRPGLTGLSSTSSSSSSVLYIAPPF
jgi:hypothetical protein